MPSFSNLAFTTCGGRNNVIHIESFRISQTTGPSSVQYSPSFHTSIYRCIHLSTRFSSLSNLRDSPLPHKIYSVPNLLSMAIRKDRHSGVHINGV